MLNPINQHCAPNLGKINDYTFIKDQLQLLPLYIFVGETDVIKIVQVTFQMFIYILLFKSSK
jgi:hypothetical protein